MLYVRCDVRGFVSIDDRRVGETNRVLSDLPADKALRIVVTRQDDEKQKIERTVTLERGCITRVEVTFRPKETSSVRPEGAVEEEAPRP